MRVLFFANSFGIWIEWNLFENINLNWSRHKMSSISNGFEPMHMHNPNTLYCECLCLSTSVCLSSNPFIGQQTAGKWGSCSILRWFEIVILRLERLKVDHLTTAGSSQNARSILCRTQFPSISLTVKYSNTLRRGLKTRCKWSGWTDSRVSVPYKSNTSLA